MQSLAVGKPSRGARLVYLQSGFAPVVGGLKTPTQNDARVMGLHRINVLHGNLVSFQFNIKDGWEKRTLDLSIFNETSPDAKRLRVMTVCTTLSSKWSNADTVHLVRMIRDSACNILVLPSDRQETVESLEARRLAAQAIARDLAPHLTILIGIDIQVPAPKFRALWNAINAAKDPFIPVRLTGFVGGKSNLNLIGNTVAESTLNNPPFVFGYDAERWIRGDIQRGAATIFLRRFGFQTVALRVYRSWAEDEEEEEGLEEEPIVRRFQPITGGYDIRYGNLPPELPERLARATLLTDLLDQRRFEENLLFSNASQDIEDAIRAGNFAHVRRTRPAVNNALQMLGLTTELPVDQATEMAASLGF